MAFRRGFRRGGFREHREINLDQAAEYLQEVVSRVKANPDEFEALKKVFKKNVPLTMRSWVAAYLLRNSSGSIAHFGFRKEREERESNGTKTERRYSRDENQTAQGETSASTESSSSETREAREPRERFTRVEIAPDQAASIFVGVGRNRRVFPRDLVGLFISQAGIEKERIGHITVLANYSFVQLFKEDADKAINALNGYMFRGRPLSVSYSKNEDGASSEVSESKSEVSQAESTESSSSSSEDYENNEPVPNVSNASAPIADSFTKTNNDTLSEQAAFAKAQAEMTDEEILAARRPRSSSSEDVTN